ncbi:MAG: DNA-processing protein DprA [Candidatus Altimarinota bacterium]
MDKELLAYAFLLQVGYTHKELKDLLINNNTSLSAYELWKNTKDGIFPSLNVGRIEKIEEKIKKISEADIEELLKNLSVEIITQKDSRYPKNLCSIHHAPAFFYMRGKIAAQKRYIGVVGSRKHTHYAKETLIKILPQIIQSGIGIVSGGATGVDTLGHEICIDEGGDTLVVLGTGIDICYPSRNRELFEKVVSSGSAIISHFPLGIGPEPYNFPIRNELVAAISIGIIIPEAGLSSGTLITAQLALEHGRDVFAIPGDIFRTTSEGTNMLIASGQAKCVRCSGDILEEYFEVKNIGSGMSPIVKAPPVFSNDIEKQIYEAIMNGFTSIDELLGETGLDTILLLSHTSLLEVQGHIKLDEMGRYRVN